MDIALPFFYQRYSNVFFSMHDNIFLSVLSQKKKKYNILYTNHYELILIFFAVGKCSYNVLNTLPVLIAQHNIILGMHGLNQNEAYVNHPTSSSL